MGSKGNKPFVLSLSIWLAGCLFSNILPSGKDPVCVSTRPSPRDRVYIMTESGLQFAILALGESNSEKARSQIFGEIPSENLIGKSYRNLAQFWPEKFHTERFIENTMHIPFCIIKHSEIFCTIM